MHPLLEGFKEIAEKKVLRIRPPEGSAGTCLLEVRWPDNISKRSDTDAD